MLGWLRTMRRRSPETNCLSDADRFQELIDRERLRAERSRTELALLSFELPPDSQSSTIGSAVGRVLARRLRSIDRAGLLPDGRLAVLLPDTTAEGARQLLAAVSEALAEQGIALQHELVTYPILDQTTRQQPEPANVSDRRVGIVEPPDMQQHMNPVGR